MKRISMNHKFLVPPGKKVRLKDYDPAYTGTFKGKQNARTLLAEDIKKMAQYQDVLYAQGEYALLIIIQAMDAAGKDGVIKHFDVRSEPARMPGLQLQSPLDRRAFS